MSPRRSIVMLVALGALGTVSACGPNADSRAGVVDAADIASPSNEIESTTDGSSTSLVDEEADRSPTDAALDAVVVTDGSMTTLAGDERQPMPDSVVVIGDSIALSVQPNATTTLESLGIEVLAYDAVESRRMVSGSTSLPSGETAILGVLDHDVDAELWIVELGTNDVGAGAPEEQVRADIDRVLALVPADADLLWIDTWMRDQATRTSAFNSLLREQLRDRDDTWVVDWYGRGDIEGLTIADGIHLTEVGKVEYARMIGDALRAIYARR